MSARDDLLNAAKTTHNKISNSATDIATSAFMANLAESRCPSKDELQSAMIAARIRLQDILFSHVTLETLGCVNAADAQIAAMKLKFREFERPLNCPPLTASTDVPPIRLPLAAMLGAILGMLIGSPIGIYFLDMRDTGLFVGASVGALIVPWALDCASRNVWASRFLITSLGAATAVEGWAYLSANPLAVIWQKLSGRKSIERIAIYTGLIALLIFTRRRATYERAVLELSARQSIDDWLNDALVVLAILVRVRDGEHRTEKGLTELGRRIMELHVAPADQVAGLAQEVVDAARDAGFEGLEQRNGSRQTGDYDVLTWADSMNARYSTFGHIEAGDKVRVEQEPVVRDGEVQEKGLVRKHRGA